MKRFALLTLLVAAVCVSLPAAGQVSITPSVEWAGKVRAYANPFMDGGAVNGTITGPLLWSASTSASLVNRRSDQGAYGRWQRSSTTADDTFQATYQMPAGQTFQAGTVIAVQSVYTGYYNNLPYEIRLGTDGTATDWSSIAPSLTGPGTIAKKTIRTTTLDGGMYNTFRLDAVPSGYFHAGSEFPLTVDFDEIIILPDRLEHISDVTVAASNTSWGNKDFLLGMDNAYDGTNSSSPGWTGSGTLTFTFGLIDGELPEIDAIVFWSYNNHDANFTLKYMDNGVEVAVADISMIREGGRGWTLPIQLDKSIKSDTIILDFNGTPAGLREVMFFTSAPPIPEPATLTLLALGGLAMLRRRR